MEEKKYQAWLQTLDYIKQPESLEKNILVRIQDETKRLRRFKVLVFGMSTAFSLGISSWAVLILINNIKQSGFGQYLSLFFTENGLALIYWRELSLSLIESLPIVGLILLLSSAGLLVWSAVNVLRSVKVFNISFN